MAKSKTKIVKCTIDPDQADIPFITQVCKFEKCPGRYFKVDFTTNTKEEITYCPYCGYKGQFWTLDQMKYLNCMAENDTKPNPAQICQGLGLKPVDPGNPPPDPSENPKKLFTYPNGDRIRHNGETVIKDYLFGLPDGKVYKYQ